jgi:ATP-binding cassette subfamily B protein
LFASAEKETSDDGIRLRSALPGRERWEIDALIGRPRLASRLEQLLSGRSDVVTARSNAVTGRLLIIYDPNVEAEDLEIHIRTALESSLAAIDFEPAQRSRAAEPEPEEGTSLTGSGIAAGVVLAATSLVLGAAPLAALALGGAAVAAAAATAHGLARQREIRNATSADRPQSDPLPRFLAYAAPYRRQIVLASACSVLKKIFDVAPPLLIGLGISIATPGGSPLLAAIGLTTFIAQLAALGALTIFIFTGESAFEYAQKILWRRLAQELQRDLRLDAYARVQDMQLATLDEESIAAIAIPLTEQINQIESFMNGGVDALLQLATNVVLLVTIFIAVAPNLAWIATLPVPLLIWRTFRYQRDITPLYAAAGEKAAALNKQVVTNIIGLPTIRSFGAEEVENERIRRLSQDYVDSNEPANAMYAAFMPAFRFPVLAAFSGILLFGAIKVSAGTMLASQYALIMFLVQRFLFPFAYFGELVDNYQRTMGAIDRVFALLDLPVGPLGGDEALPPEHVRGEIAFKNVSFGYPSNGCVLENFSLHVPAGNTVALVGVTGIGKSTIIKILLRFYEFDGGSVTLDGHDIRNLRLRDLRSSISLVSQDLFLFDGTIYDNIVYGTFGAPLDDVAAAAETAGIRGFIEDLPRQYETPIGERGSKLSTGQRQRICLARAILKMKQARILVLDEATSAVDSETEAAIQRSLEEVSRNRTTLVIAHRLSTVRTADEICVLGFGGTIIERGSHEELLRRDGFYARLWRVQRDEADLGLEVRPATSVSEVS